jgi:hypothetical protein
MRFNLTRAIKYWFKATFKPQETIEELQSDPHRVVISFWITFLFALLYSITPLLLYHSHILPVIPPWMPIDIEKYYLYQPFWTIPWGLATWIMISGISHLLSIAGKKDAFKYKFEDALIVCSLGWVVPSFYLMWFPETLLVPFFGEFWPAWVNMLRVVILPTMWQTLLIGIGLRKTHNVNWIRGIGIGFVTVIVCFIMFLAFMR